MEVLPFTNVKYENENALFDYGVDEEQAAMVEALAARLEGELRRAKRTHLSAGEVLLPHGLTRTIAADMYLLADIEPCGLRGCTLYIHFEERPLCTIKCDPTTPTTFQLYLTLKQVPNSWNTFLPQFFKKITRGGSTVMISTEYEMQKNKLYRSTIE